MLARLHGVPDVAVVRLCNMGMYMRAWCIEHVKSKMEAAVLGNPATSHWHGMQSVATVELVMKDCLRNSSGLVSLEDSKRGVANPAYW
jgi:hypothetical protein